MRWLQAAALDRARARHRPAAVAGPSAPVATGEDAPLPLWPKVKKGTLANGLTYYILPHGKPEKRALLWLAVNAGSVQEDDDQRGLAHFVEHMAFNGTKRFPKAQIVDYLEKIGMRFGADLNAYTSFDETVYQLEVPTDDPAFVGKGLDILRDWAGDISFDHAEVEKERGVVLEEWRLGRGASERVFDKQVKVLFKGSRYADRLPIGKPEIIKRAPRDALVRVLQGLVPPRPDGGDRGRRHRRRRRSRRRSRRGSAISRTRRRRARAPAAGVPAADGHARVDRDRQGAAGGTSVQVAQRVPAPARGDAEATSAGIIAEQIYGQMINERLGSLARRKEAPFSAAGVGVSSFVRDVDAFTRGAQVKGDADRGRAAQPVRRGAARRAARLHAGRARSRAHEHRARSYEQIADEEATSSSREFTSEITRNFFEGEFMIGRKAERDQTLAVLPTITVAELNAARAAASAARTTA